MKKISLKKNSMKKKSRIVNALVYMLMLLMIGFMMFFIVFLVRGSLMNDKDLSLIFGTLNNGNNSMNFVTFHMIPNAFSMLQFKKVLWDTSDFWFYFWNSIFYSLTILVGTIFVSISGGYAFAKFRFPLRRFWLAVYIIVMMIPYQVMISPTFIVLNNLGLINTRSALILPNLFTPFGTYLIYQFMCTIPDEMLEAARVDGAGNIKILIKIVLPQIKGGIASLAVLNFIDTWNLVEQPIMFLKNEFKYPLSAALSYFQNQDIGTAFACGVAFLIPVTLVFLLGKNYMIEGIKNSVVGK